MAYIEYINENKRNPNYGRDSYAISNSSSEPENGIKFYEIEPAIVLRQLDGNGKIEIYALIGKGTIKAAYPKNQNIKSIPLPGEIVLFTFHKLEKNSSNVVFFYEPVSWFRNVNQNDSPILLEKIKKLISGSKELLSKRLNLQITEGIPVNLRENILKTGNNFSFSAKNNSILTPIEGDIIFQGRSLQSIRFTSTIPKISEVGPWSGATWGYSKSNKGGGDPLIFISCGKKGASEEKEYIFEDLQSDPSLIFMSGNGQYSPNISFLISANEVKPKNFKIPDTFDYATIIMNSDSTIINSRLQDIVLSSNNNIIAVSNGNIVLKTKNTAEISAPLINLGEDAKKIGQAVVKDKDLRDFFISLIDAVLSLQYDNYGSVIVGTDSKLKSLKFNLERKENEFPFSSKNTFTL